MKISEMKRMGRGTLKRHYAMFLILCLLLGFLGVEYKSSLDSLSMGAQDTYFLVNKGERPTINDLVQQYKEKININNVRGIISKDEGIMDNILRLFVNLSNVNSGTDIVSSGAFPEIMGRSRGVLAGIVNRFSGGSLLSTLVAGVASMNASKGLTWILILLSMALSVFIWYFVKDIFRVVVRRMALESRTYEKVPYQKIFFVMTPKKWLRTGCTLLITGVFYMLWCLTVVGAVVKHYSYYMVPFILAENPEMSAREAITLSRRMMDGYKMKCFLMDLSFIGWWLLSAITFGLTGIFFSNGYKLATEGEFYTFVRERALASKVERCELLNDEYLFKKASKEVILDAYEEVIDEYPYKKPDPLTGVLGVLSNLFGLVINITPRIRKIEEWKIERTQHHNDMAAVRGEIYPDRLLKSYTAKERGLVNFLNYNRYYTVWNVILLFIIFCFIGWLWEVSLHLITTGNLVNRGMLHGPWLPIYGSGGIVILLLLKKLRNKPIIMFAVTVVLCGAIEYFASLFMELSTGQRWWDYTGYFLNFNGRVCAEGLFVFGLMGMIIVYIVAPVIDHFLRKIPGKIATAVAIILIGLFMVDLVYSKFVPNTGEGITESKPAVTEQVKQ